MRARARAVPSAPVRCNAAPLLCSSWTLCRLTKPSQAARDRAVHLLSAMPRLLWRSLVSVLSLALLAPSCEAKVAKLDSRAAASRLGTVTLVMDF